MLHRQRAFAALLSIVATFFVSPQSHAADYLSFNVGAFDVFDDTYDATQFGFEYRAEAYQYDLRPIVGGFFTSEGSLYGYVGANLDIALIPNELYLIPNFAVGAYAKGDDGKDLGGAIEFRSGIEVAYQFTNDHQLGLALNHISNAGLYNRNPGAETLMVTYSVPLNNISHIIGGQ